jgi:SNF2 family DNA or RNA helicase
MTPEYYAKYKKLEDKIKGRRELKEGEELKNSFMVKLRKASNDLSPCLKCDKTLEILSNGLKTVIYSEFIDSGISIIQNSLDKKGIRHITITGKVPKKKRQDLVDEMNDPKGPQVFFITRAGGQGLDLKRIRQVILIEKGWTVESEEQVIGRAIRFRSHADLPLNERNVTIYHLVLIKPEDAGLISNRIDPKAKIDIMSPKKGGDHIISADLYMMKKSRGKDVLNKMIEARLEACQLK